MSPERAAQLANRKAHRKIRAKLRLCEDPILSTTCTGVAISDLNTPDVQEMASTLLGGLDAFETAVGLAAPQMGYSKRAIAIWPHRSGQPQLLLDPKVITHSETGTVRVEGCLSYPGTETPIARYDWVTVRYLTLQGEEKTERFEDFAARVVQHEIDHTFGTCQVKTGSKLPMDIPSAPPPPPTPEQRQARQNARMAMTVAAAIIAAGAS